MLIKLLFYESVYQLPEKASGLEERNAEGKGTIWLQLSLRNETMADVFIGLKATYALLISKMEKTIRLNICLQK
jgi:hypothetical protein